MHGYAINIKQCNCNTQWTPALKKPLHFGEDVDYFEELSHYSFGAGVVKLNKGIKVRELFENAVFNQTNFGYCNLSSTTEKSEVSKMDFSIF